MRTILAILFVGIVAWFAAWILSGCTHAPRVAETAIEAWEIMQEQEAMIDEATDETEDITDDTQETDESDWRTWKNAPEELVQGAPYHRNGDGKFEYRGGGHGLYKPETSLWLVNGLKAEHVAVGAVYHDATCTNPVIRNGSCVFLTHNNKPVNEANPITNFDDPNHYHPKHLTLGGFKFRNATAVQSGQVLGCWTKDGRLYAKYIYDRNVRQK